MSSNPLLELSKQNASFLSDSLSTQGAGPQHVKFPFKLSSISWHDHIYVILTTTIRSDRYTPVDILLDSIRDIASAKTRYFLLLLLQFFQPAGDYISLFLLSGFIKFCELLHRLFPVALMSSPFLFFSWGTYKSFKAKIIRLQPISVYKSDLVTLLLALSFSKDSPPCPTSPHDVVCILISPFPKLHSVTNKYFSGVIPFFPSIWNSSKKLATSFFRSQESRPEYVAMQITFTKIRVGKLSKISFCIFIIQIVLCRHFLLRTPRLASCP